jgi:hypothetical protein
MFILSILDQNDKFKDINSTIREYCEQYLANAGYKDMESGKTATIPNTDMKQIESIHENNISSSLIDSIDNPETDYWLICFSTCSGLDRVCCIRKCGVGQSVLVLSVSPF